MLTATGAEATSLEGGLQIGRYWGKKLLGEQVSLINVVNGTAGTVGIRIPLGNLVEGQPVVLTSGALSGCTMIYAYDSQYVYA
ncbi:cytotoxic necrotizing factor Rho-activating domain-containing protein [Aeromonas veronii]|uniref:cytotoxic necrotizing factor Rho-activating domain-containing protein n=1 Tax=Aeromonas veronii TaxID=654 RepID=UPI003BF7EA4E